MTVEASASRPSQTLNFYEQLDIEDDLIMEKLMEGVYDPSIKMYRFYGLNDTHRLYGLGPIVPKRGRSFSWDWGCLMKACNKLKLRVERPEDRIGGMDYDAVFNSIPQLNALTTYLELIVFLRHDIVFKQIHPNP